LIIQFFVITDHGKLIDFYIRDRTRNYIISDMSISVSTSPSKPRDNDLKTADAYHKKDMKHIPWHGDVQSQTSWYNERSGIPWHNEQTKTFWYSNKHSGTSWYYNEQLETPWYK